MFIYLIIFDVYNIYLSNIILEISYLFSKNVLIKFTIICIPNFKSNCNDTNETKSITDCNELTFHFSRNSTFKELKNELEKTFNLKDDKYYFVYFDKIMNYDEYLKDNGIVDNCFIYAVNNGYVRINIEVEDDKGWIQQIKDYISMSLIQVIKADKNKVIKVCNNYLMLNFYLIFIIIVIFIKDEELNLVINLLKNESSQHLSILNDSLNLLDSSLIYNL